MANVRAPEMWRQIAEHVDFKGKSVIDLGCGYGDLLRYAYDEGKAALVVGVDKNPPELGLPGYVAIESDIEEFCENNRSTFDVGICTSVLPYLVEPGYVLDWLADHCRQVIIEAQLYGDGPGLKRHQTDTDLAEWFSDYFSSVKIIGQTVPEGRSHRSLWLCENDA